MKNPWLMFKEYLSSRLPNFVRSLGYLRPYRGRIIVAIVCTIFIAALWGGGLAMVLPGTKVMMEDEGIHGWAYGLLVKDHIHVPLGEHDPRKAFNPDEVRRIFGQDSLEKALRVDIPGKRLEKPEKKNQDLPGLQDGDWIVKLGEQSYSESFTFKDMILAIARLRPGDQVNLTVVTAPVPGVPPSPPQEIVFEAGEEGVPSSILKAIAVEVRSNGEPLLPEPTDYSGRFPMFVTFLTVAVIITVLRSIFMFFQEYLVGQAIWLGVMDLRCQNYNVVLHLPTTFFSDKGVSDATSRFIQDTNELARGQNTLLGKTMVEPAKAIASIAVAMYYSWPLTLMAMLGGPPAYWLIRKLGKGMHRASRKALESWSLMLGMLAETLIGIRVVKAYTMEGQERKRFFHVNRQLVKQQIKKERLDATTGPVVECLGIVAAMIAAAIAGYLVFKGHPWINGGEPMDRSVFVTWMVALFAMMDPTRKLAKVSMRFNESEAAAKRVFELQDIPQEKTVPLAPTLGRHSRSIEFRQVDFRYPGAAESALRGVDLTIGAAQTVAFVGPNGSGKTTLVSLVPRLLDPQQGKVLIDGTDISQVSMRSLRRQIALVTQESILFHASIADNIAYGKPRATREEILSAAKKAYVDEFVREMPQGYDTMVGEHGSTLSGGQRQRIAIARAILRDPAILIFDEALSQIDPDSESKIHAAMEQFRQGRTCLIIAHRFHTILDADMLVVLDAGRVVDAGTHAQLQDRCPLYRTLYQRQYAAFEAEGK
jgi:ABC-type multidrug transport system fused ATPase/permease subunit